MKLILAVASLWAVAVFALRGDQTRQRYTELEDGDVEVFRAGQTYTYRLDTQISSGLAAVSDQHAVTRLQAEAQLHFQSDRSVALKLKDITIGTINQEVQDPEQIQPMQMFKETEIKSEESRQLELPCEFDYTDGLVERVRFQQQDQPWSRNIKKAVLNMLQINLKQRKGQGVLLEQPESWQKEREQQDSLTRPNGQFQQRMFVMPETTLEGECQVTYTINPENPRSKSNGYYDDQIGYGNKNKNKNEYEREEKEGKERTEKSERSEKGMFNVTKTIDFHRCSKIADIRYGPKIEKPCQNCTSQQELEERKLDRTTVMRHVVVGSPEKYGIKKAEVVSHYLFKMLNVEEETPMHTIVATRLILVRSDDRTEIERQLKQRIETNGKAESLLYSIEFDTKEKLFYMFGDEEFPQETPFEKVQDKVGKVEGIMKKLLSMWSDKLKGIDSEATLVYTRLVELLRMCSQSELEKIYARIAQGNKYEESESEQEGSRPKDILIDALANAGTLNTIKVLVEKVKRRDVHPTKAARAIAQLKDLPAPSEKQVKLLTEMCEQTTCDQHEPCRQICWLTVGNLVGELCDDELTVKDAVEQLKPQCHQQLKKDFVSKAMRKFESVETRYKKIMILKALGNAGLEQSVVELEKIIRSPREDPLVRMQAIDSLRRLRATMPQKIQRALLPVFQDVRERPEVRMMAVSQILATFPERSVLDQIGYTLLREPSRQVKSYVYKAVKELSESPIEVEKEVAQHLKALLKLADITEEDEETLVRGSRYYRIPVYSQAKKEGLFFDFESIFGSDNLLPKHLSVGMDTIFNGLFQKNALEVSLTQEDIEQWFEKLMDMYMDYYSYGSSDKQSKSQSQLRANRRRFSSSDEDESDDSSSNPGFAKIIKDLGIQRRPSQQQQRRRVDSDSNKKNNAPYAMLNFRYGDIDYATLPLEEEFLPASLRKIFAEGRQPSFSDLQDMIELFHGRKFRAQGAMNLLENSVKIPTTAGLPIRMWHVIPLLASVEGQIQVEMREQSAHVKLHPMVAITHLKRVEVWSPIVHTGVDSTRTVAINLPINSRFGTSDKKGSFEWSVELPQRESTRVLNLHTLPATYTTEYEWFQQRTPVVKRIESRTLVHRAQHVQTTYGKRDFGMPIKVEGELHYPHRLSYQGIVAALLSTENHVHVEYTPEEESTRKIVLVAEGRFFQPNSDSRDSHRQMKNFHSKSRFDTEMDSYYGDDNNDNRDNESDERQLNQFLDNYEQKKVYRHSVSLELKTVGGRMEKRAQIEVEANCDSRHRYVRAQLKAKRSALPSLMGESSGTQWNMKTDVQTVLPDVHSSMQQYTRQGQSQGQYQGEDSQKQQRLVAKIDSEWGTADQTQQIRVSINGEQGRNPEWRHKVAQIERLNSPDSQRLHQQMIRKAAFLNKWDVSAEYENLAPETKNTLNTMANMLKYWSFWQTKVEPKKNGQSQNQHKEQRDGQVTATIVIDPMTHEHANITLKTPVEIVRIDSLPLLFKLKPFKLVKARQNDQSIDSFTDIIRDYASESRQECKVNSRKIRSFDGVIFQAPLTKCYSVLAKDCQNSKNPRFAVLMKKVDGQDKAIKVMTRDDTIEVESKNGRLAVKINGKHEESTDKLEEYGIDYSRSSVRINTRDVTVRFDGQDASIKIADAHKNTQCGLCGHYDDDSEDEFRMGNNELTSDLKNFHKSYSLVDADCNDDFDQTHRRDEYKPLKKGRRSSNYGDSDQDFDQEFDRSDRDSDWFDSQQKQRRSNDNDEIDPIEKTETMEYKHKICFSVKPVKACPEDSYPGKTKEMKVGFACLDRSSSEARRLLRDAQRSDSPIRLPSSKPSFVETITVPSACLAY